MGLKVLTILYNSSSDGGFECHLIRKFILIYLL